MRKGCAGRLEITILPQFLAIEPHFVRKGCAGQVEIAILPQFLAIEPHFVRKGCAGQVEIAILPQFLPIDPHFVRKGCSGTNHNFSSVFADRPSFRVKGLLRHNSNRNFSSVFADRPSFRAKGLRFVPSRLHCPAPAFRREIEKKERARGQEGKRRRCEDVRM